MTHIRRNKILSVSHYYPPHLGGVEVVAQKQAESFVNQGYDVHVVSSGVDGCRLGTSTERGVEIYRGRTFNFIERSIGVPFPIPALSTLIRLYKEVHEADVVHLHDVFYPISWATYLFTRFAWKPLVLTQHVAMVDHASPFVMMLQRLVYASIGAKIFHYARAIIVYNRNVHDFLISRSVSQEKVTEVRNGIDCVSWGSSQHSREEVLARHNIPSDRPIALFVGRLVTKKGYDLLYGARAAEYTIVFAGPGEVPLDWKNDPLTRFIGPADKQTLIDLCHSVDLFVFPAVGEIFTLTMQEAMASGLPVIIADDPGYRAYDIDRNLISLVARDSESIKAAILAVVADKTKAREMGAYSRALATRWFDWDSNFAAILRIYEHLFSAQKNKIAVVAPYYPPKVGGLEHYAHTVAKGIIEKAEFDVVVITSNHLSRGYRYDIVDGVHVHRLPVLFRISNTPLHPFWYWWFKRMFRSEQVTLVHAHAPVPIFADIAAWASVAMPFVLTYHSGSLKKGKLIADAIIAPYERFLLPRLFARADRIVSVSRTFAAREFARYGAKAIVITPSVDVERFIPSSIPAEEKRVLFVGRIERNSSWKGVDILIRSFALLGAEVPGVLLEVVGGGDAVDDHRALAERLGVTSRVIFSGPLVGEELVSAFSRSSVLVLPSLTEAESFGMVLIEAMASGRPVIGSDVGGIPDVIEDGVSGRLVPPGDAHALAAAMKAIISDRSLAIAYAEKGRARVLERYSVTTQVEQYHKLFESIKESYPPIVHVSAFYPPHLGGLERVVSQCAEGLAKRGVSVRVITTTKSGLPRGTTRVNGVEITALSSLELANVPFAPSLPLELLMLPKNTIIHLHLAQAFFPEWVFFISKLRRMRYIVHFHLDVGPSGVFGKLFLIYKRLVWGPLLRGADVVVACGAEMAPIIEQKYGVEKERVVIIPNAVSDRFFIDRTYQPDDERLRLLSVGRLAPQKCLERMIEALSLVQTPVSLTIVGDGPERARLEELVHTKGLINVTFVGRKDDTEMHAIVAVHDLFLITSLREGLPLSVLEAMAGGLPVLATDVEGLHNLVKGTGVLVGEPYVERIAEEIDRLNHSRGLLTEFSRKSVQTARTYGESGFIDRLLTIYSRTR